MMPPPDQISSGLSESPPPAPTVSGSLYSIVRGDLSKVTPFENCVTMRSLYLPSVKAGTRAMIRLGSFCVRRRVTGVTFSPSSDTKKIPTELSAPLIRIRSPSISMSSFGVIEPLDNPVKVSVTMPMRPTSDS